MFRSRFLPLFLAPALLIAETPENQLAEAERLAWLKNWTRAEPFFAAAERGFEARGDKRNSLFSHIGGLRGRLPRLPLVETSDKLAALLDDPTVQHDPELKLRCLVVKGDVDMDVDVELAYRDWTEALAVAQQIGHKGWINRANGELGIIAFLRGDSRTSVMRIYGALQTAKKQGDVGGHLRYLTIIASGLTELGSPDQALRMFDEAIAITESNPDLTASLMAYTGKLQALVSLKRAAEAKELMAKALTMAREKGSVGYEAELRMQLGLLANKSGNLKTAFEELQKAAELAGTIDGHRQVGIANLHISQLALQAGMTAEAEKASLAGLRASRAAGDRYFVPKHLAQLAEVHVAKKQYRAAHELYEAAADVMQGMLVNAASSGTKASLIAVMEQVYTGYFRTEAKHLGRLDYAFEAIEQARGRAVTDILRVKPSSDQAAPARLSATERRISRLQIQLGNAANRAERRRLLTELHAVEQELNPLQATYEKAWLQVETRPATLKQIRATLQPDEVLVQYVLGEPASYCIVVRRDSATFHELPSKAKISKLTDAFLNEIRKDSTATGTGRDLYTALLGTVRLPSATKRLIIVPDGVMNRIPFEALVDATGRNVIESYTVSYAPSATAFHILRSRRSSARSALPLFAVAATSSTASHDPKEAVAAKRSVPPGIFDTSVSELPALPAASREVRQIAEAMGPQSVVLLGGDGGESAVKAQPLSRYRVLHFATHGLVSSRYPDRSALILDADAKEDGLLQAREIGRMRLNAELVTLTACDAGAGRITGQEGVANLVRPFLVSGARSVMANLWHVNDEFSRSLMKEFYSRLASGADKAVALRQAKLELIRRYGKDAHPGMWAGFILVGDNRGVVSGGQR